jgi:hypothetical protein
MTTPVHVFELGQTAIGLAVAEEPRRVRFFAAVTPYDQLDGQVFTRTRAILAAARTLRRLQRPAR